MKFSFVSSVFAAVFVLFSEELDAVARDAYICLNDFADGLSLASDTRVITFAAGS